MSDIEYPFHEPVSPLSPENRPNFYDLQDNAEAGIVRRGIARYLFTRNYERSIKVHRMIGSPIMRKIVMGTVGRLNSKSGEGGNYRLDHSKSRIEAATNFAINGSVFNEAVHTVAALPASVDIAVSVAEGRYGSSFGANVAGAGFNWALVALQRYNRARMIKRVDEELSEGAIYQPRYRNWLGIDGRAVENYVNDAKQSSAAEPLPWQADDIGDALSNPDAV
jgi:hypothetical protein